MDNNELKLFYVIFIFEIIYFNFFNTLDTWHDLIGPPNTCVRLN